MTLHHPLGCRICTLYSGSGGNATLVEAAGVRILIDAGKSARALVTALKSLGISDSPDRPLVDGIFLTHEHTDHTRALPVLLKKRTIPVHVTAPSCAGLLASCDGESLRDRLCVHPPLYREALGGVSVESFPTSHDSAFCVGYRITFPTPDGETCSVGYATDLGYISNDVRTALSGCTAVVLESNHDPDMLLDGPYPYPLKRRIASRSGHLSNPDAAAFSAELAENGTRYILLAHLSKENNYPDLAYAEVSAAIAREDVVLRVASPDAVTLLLDDTAEAEPKENVC